MKLVPIQKSVRWLWNLWLILWLFVLCIFAKVSFFSAIQKKGKWRRKIRNTSGNFVCRLLNKKGNFSREREQRHWVQKFELFPRINLQAVIVNRRNLHSFWEKKHKILYWLKITSGEILFSSINHETWAKKCYKFTSFAIFSFFFHNRISLLCL